MCPTVSGDVPADVVVSRAGRHRHSRLDLEARDERGDRGLARDGHQFRGGEDCGPLRRAAMDRGAVRVEGVVEVQQMRRDPIGQRRVSGRRTLARTDDGPGARSVPGSRAAMPARTLAASSVAEPASVQPSQSTRQRTAWCTSDSGVCQAEERPPDSLGRSEATASSTQAS